MAQPIDLSEFPPGMLYRVALVAGTLSVVCPAWAQAEPTPVAGRTLNEIVPNATVHLDTPLGTKIPIKFTPGGLMSGDAGNLSWFLGSANDRGRWWVAGDRLCQKWFKWFDAEVQCLHLKRDGQHLFWTRDDGKTGTATLIAAEPVPPPTYALGHPTVADARADAPASPEPTAAASATKSAPADVPEASEPPPRPDPRRAASSAPHQTIASAKISRTATPRGDATISDQAIAAVALTAPHPDPKLKNLPVAVGSARVVSMAPTEPATPRGNVSFRVAGVAPDDVLNVRQRPFAEASPVGAIAPHGEGLRLMGRCQHEWCPITHHGLTGWVNSFYLVEED